MTQRTERQIQADDALERAIQESLLAYYGDDGDDIGIVTDYIVALNASSVDDAGGGFFTLMAGGTIPTYRALGLLTRAEDVVRGHCH